MDYPHGVMVTVRNTVAVVDDLGDSDDASPTTSEWGPCAVAPRTSTERADSRSPAVITGLTIYGPKRELKATDQLVIDGDVYDIEGIPGDWTSPFTGWEPGIEVAVTRASAS